MMLHIIYRSYGGENFKDRPEYYSKDLALGSLLRAYATLAPGVADLIFLNDGPIPESRLAVMRKHGEVIEKSRMGNVGSLTAAYKLPSQRGWAPDDVVWFAEDDYLYLPRALVDLMSAADAYPKANYFGLYALIGNRQPNGLPPADSRGTHNWYAGISSNINGWPWCRGLSTTSTFGARAKDITSDRTMLLFAMRCGDAFDHTTCLAYRGITPYPTSFIVESISSAAKAGKLTKIIAATVVRAAFNIYVAIRRTKVSSRELITSDPPLATHMEAELLGAGTDWSEVARETQAWMQCQGSAYTIRPQSASIQTRAAGWHHDA